MGIPTHEAPLVQQVVDSIDKLYRPTRGYMRVLIEQADLPTGMPDVLAIHCSYRSVARLVDRGLRLDNARQARALGMAGGDRGSRPLSDHDRRLVRRLKERGWDDARPQVASIADAISFEVKVRDWKAGIGQLTRYSSFASRTVLALPADAIGRIPSNYLKTSGAGLVRLGPAGPRLVRRGRQRTISLTGKLWLGELAARKLEHQRMPSSSANKSSA